MSQLLLYNRADTLVGRITDENNKPLDGVSVRNAASNSFVITSYEGIFKLPWPPGSKEVEFTYVSYEKKSLRVTDPNAFLGVTLKPAFGAQEEVVTMSYYQVTRRDNTGSNFRVRGQELTNGSNNPFSELSGRVPGLTSTLSGGAPGAASRLQIRGRQSIGTVPGNDNQPYNDPLVVINKIPFAGSKPVSLLPSAAGDPQGGGLSGGGISAQAAINPADIETVDVLKDADATALYGSGGAHGALLIATRMGRISKPTLRFNIQKGAVASTYVPELLDNREYTAMRKEALAAANLPINQSTAPDLLRLDTNNYINIPQLLAGNTGQLINVNASLQGGDTLLRYYLNAGYYRESSVMSKSLPQQRFTSHANIRYMSPGRRLQVDVSLLYSHLNYNSIASDPILYAGKLVPLLPSLRDENGQLVWMYNSFDFRNPLGQFENSSDTRINTFSVGLQGSYQLGKGLYFRTTLGYQSLPVKEELTLRMAAGYPNSERAVASNKLQSIIAEPRLEYEHKTGSYFQWGGLLGGTVQNEIRKWMVTRYDGYANDSMLGLPGIPPSERSWGDNTYRFRALYSRWHADWDKRYFINATGRLDASSRLGPKRKTALFWALGGAWVFSDEKWFRSFERLDYGKLRASYGIAGNDNYANYGFETRAYWLSRQQDPDSVVMLSPFQQGKPQLEWEKNYKLEVALELAAFRSLQFNVAWYRNVTSNQLLTIQQSDTPAIVNWPARVLNTGWEFYLRYNIGQGKKISYTSTLMLTLPRNRLLSFPGLDTSGYRNSLIVGQPLSVQRGFQFEGVNPATGLFIVPANPDTIITGHWEPQAYASWSQEWRLGRFSIGLFIEARKQQTLHPLYYVYSSGGGPGRWSAAQQQQTNQPRTVLQRWQKPGDMALLQRFTASNSPDVQAAIKFFRQSSMMMADASFWRIRNLYCAWELPEKWLKAAKLCEGRIYLQGQNLFTGTHFRDGDPTIQFSGRLSAQRVITAGVQVAFQ